ncbi:integumentary mucin C.1 [Biomphalaria pfeifferi]|uniref:Integumentary mucin C.1 n=1 Tax=Biomphalaria pfeifferi TaxID=112525 RepID=A0AAD8ASR8_BIOPF|nr:integumentary mucin C.1 [Biomphalaria pfeifferi]
METILHSRALLGCLLLLASVAVAIKDGTSSNACDYPGLAVILSTKDAVICNAVFLSSNQFIVPEICGAAMNTFLKKSALKLSYNQVPVNITIPVGTSGVLGDGVYSFTLNTPIQNSCSSVARVYDSKTMTLDLATCQVVGYGAATSSSKIFDGVLNAAAVNKSTSSSCCLAIWDSLTKTEKGTTYKDASYNCLTSTGATCGTGDVGAPVYCKTDSGERVLTALTSSTPCVSGGVFLAHDLTAGATDFKFGY